MRYFKCDTTEFNGFSPDLAIVGVYLQVQKVERAIERTKESIRELEADNANTAQRVLAMAKDAAASMSPGLDEVKRLEEVKNRVTLAGSSATYAERTRQHVLAVLSQYARFDLDQLEQDLQRLYPPQEVAQGLESRRAKLAQLQERLEGLWCACAQRCFAAGIPDQFVIQGQPVHVSAEVAVRAFIRRWRERAPLFGRPVTVYGVGIHTLPEPQASIWGEAYEALGFDQLPQNVVYAFNTSDIPRVMHSTAETLSA